MSVAMLREQCAPASFCCAGDQHGKKGMDSLSRSISNVERFQYARRMIFLATVFVPFASFVVALGVSCVFFVDSLVSSAHDALKRVAEEHARDMGAYLHERQNDLGFVLDAFPAEHLAQEGSLEAVLALLNGRSPVFEGLELLDGEGNVIAFAGSRRWVAGGCAKDAWFPAARTHGRFVGDVWSDADGSRFVVAKRTDGEAPLMLCATLGVESFLDLTASGRVSGAGDVFLLNREGTVGTPGWKEGVFGSASGLEELPLPGGKSVSFVHAGVEGTRYLVALAPLNEGRWVLAARQRAVDAFNDLFQVGWHVLGIALLGGIVTLSLASTVSRRIGNALKEADEVRDVLRERLSRSVRLAELGEMASGFAHEINNPLQVMESEITMMEMFLDDFRDSGGGSAGGTGGDLRESLGELKRQIKRCSRVTTSILTFGRQESLDDTAFELGAVMRDVGEMVRKNAEIHSVDLGIDIEPESLVVAGDVGKVRQVFLNLLNNASYAVAEKFAGRPGGRLDFTARPQGQGWILIEVRDNGPGMPKTVLDNIYTPFFTTKPPQKGTGLGLSVCYGLIASMGGSIDVETRPGEGTVFRITLPSG